MRKRVLVQCGLCLLLACASENQESAPGQITVFLTAQSPSGVLYRLRDATFVIYPGIADPSNPPAPIATVSTEDNPAAASIDVAVDAGLYAVELLDGWRLDRVQPGGDVTVEARLLSSAIVLVSVAAGETSPATFRFQTDGVVISTGPGQISIGIEVEETPLCGEGRTFECSPLLERSLSCDVNGILLALTAANCARKTSTVGVYEQQVLVQFDASTVNLVQPFVDGRLRVDAAVGTVRGGLGALSPDPQDIAEEPTPCNLLLVADTPARLVTPFVTTTYAVETGASVLALVMDDLTVEIANIVGGVTLSTQTNCAWVAGPPAESINQPDIVP